MLEWPDELDVGELALESFNRLDCVSNLAEFAPLGDTVQVFIQFL